MTVEEIRSFDIWTWRHITTSTTRIGSRSSILFLLLILRDPPGFWPDTNLRVISVKWGQWGQFFIVDKPYKNMLKPWNGKTALEEKGVFRQMGMEFHYRVGGLRGREIGELFRVGYRSVSQEWRRLRDRLSDDRNVQNLFKGLLGKCNGWRIGPLIQCRGRFIHTSWLWS